MLTHWEAPLIGEVFIEGDDNVTVFLGPFENI